MNRRGFITAALGAVGLGVVAKKAPAEHAVNLKFHPDTFALAMRGLDVSPEAIRDRAIRQDLEWLARAVDRALRAARPGARIARKPNGIGVGERWSEIQLVAPLQRRSVRAACKALADDAKHWRVREFKSTAGFWLTEPEKYVVRRGRVAVAYLPPVKLKTLTLEDEMIVRPIGSYSVLWLGKVGGSRITVKSA